MLERFGVPRCCCGPTCECFEFSSATFTLTFTDRVAGAKANFYTSVQFAGAFYNNCQFFGKGTCEVTGPQYNPVYGPGCIALTDWFSDGDGVPHRLWLYAAILNCNPYQQSCANRYSARIIITNSPTSIIPGWSPPSDPFNFPQAGCTTNPLLLEFGPWNYNVLQPLIWGAWWWMYPQRATIRLTITA